jgi:hypothetical protein
MMRRRDFLAATGALGAGSLTGCTGLPGSDGDSSAPPLVENRPDAVYYPTHHEGMKMSGMKSQGNLRCALTYTFPHRFWLVTGRNREMVEINPDDSAHMMPVVWDQETGIVPPDANPQITVTQDGEQVTQLSPWAMISQPMGFHFGDNVQLSGDGTYQVEVRVGEPTTKRTGSLAESDRGVVTFSFEMEFSEESLEDISYTDVPSEQEGTEGAVSPMDMEMMPTTQVPSEESLPGTVRGTAASGDGVFVVTTLDDATRFGGTENETYLAVSPRTPYNRYMLPLMSLSGTVERNGSTVFDGILQSTIDPELNYHYGAVVSDVQPDDELTVTVDAPPQTARHEGYETAFLEMSEMNLTL